MCGGTYPVYCICVWLLDYVWLLSLEQPASSPGSCFMPEPMSLQLAGEVGRSSNGPDRELSEVKTTSGFLVHKIAAERIHLSIILQRPCSHNAA